MTLPAGQEQNGGGSPCERTVDPQGVREQGWAEGPLSQHRGRSRFWAAGTLRSQAAAGRVRPELRPAHRGTTEGRPRPRHPGRMCSARAPQDTALEWGVPPTPTQQMPVGMRGPDRGRPGQTCSDRLPRPLLSSRTSPTPHRSAGSASRSRPGLLGRNSPAPPGVLSHGSTLPGALKGESGPEGAGSHLPHQQTHACCPNPLTGR